jgi:hypothetical protein
MLALSRGALLYWHGVTAITLAAVGTGLLRQAVQQHDPLLAMVTKHFLRSKPVLVHACGLHQQAHRAGQGIGREADDDCLRQGESRP